MKKNKRGEAGIGAIIMIAITLIVGMILLISSAQNVGDTTNTITLENYSVGTSATESNSIYVTTYSAINSPVIYNATGYIVPAANYTLTNRVIDPTTGGLSIQITTASVNSLANDTWNISGVAEPLTYIPSSGGRAVASMIIIFFALAIAVVALTPSFRNGVMDLVKG